jgi:hypothetical protein
MKVSQSVAIAALLTGLVGSLPPLTAQSAGTFSARLEWVPTTPRERPDVAGKGTATATLSGNRLSVSGSFEGLPAAATVVRLHRGVATGARGPVITDLVVTRGTSGTISGTAELSPQHQDDLRRGRLYLQLHSEKGVEDGSTLWGWFLE